MQKTKKFIELEKIIYDNPLSRNLRFTNICAYSTNQIFYYDCLVPEVVLLNRVKVLGWKNGQLSEKDFPFSTKDNVNVKEQPKFDKLCWSEAVQKAEKIIPFLEVLVVEKLFDPEFADIINDRIENIKRFFDISKNHKSFLTNFQQRNIDLKKTNINDTFIDFNSLKSHKTFKEIKFLNKDKDEIYILLEKIFHNFELLSKYQVSEIYLQVKKIDTYLDNHLKNIYFCQDFTFLNFEEESLSMLNKINNYLTSEVDNYLEQCIDNQLSIINDIQANFSNNFS